MISLAKIRFDLEQIGTKVFSTIFASIGCTEQRTKNLGQFNHEKSFFFLHGIQDGRYNKKITISQRTLSSVFKIVPLGFKANFP